MAPTSRRRWERLAARPPRRPPGCAGWPRSARRSAACPEPLPVAACRALVELLGLDAAWVLEGSPVDMQVLARWARSGAAAGRLGAQRLRVLADAAVDEVSQARDGRYVLVVVRLPDGPGHSLFVIGSARSGRLLSADDLACARLVAAAHARQLQRRRAAAAHLRRRRTAGWRADGGSRSWPGPWPGSGPRSRWRRRWWTRISELVGRRLPVLPDRAVRPGSDGRARSDAASRRTGGERRRSAVERLAGRAIDERISRRIANARLESDAAGERSRRRCRRVDAGRADAGGRTEPMGVIVLVQGGPRPVRRRRPASAASVVAATAPSPASSVRLHAEQHEAARGLGGAARAGRGAVAADRASTASPDAGAARIDRLVECAALSVWLRDGDRLRLAAPRRLHAARERAADRDRLLVALAAPCRPGAAAARRDGARRRPAAAAGRPAGRRSRRASTFAVVAIGERSANRGADRRAARAAPRAAPLARRADAARHRRPGAAGDHQPRALRRARRLVPGHRARRSPTRSTPKDELHRRPRPGAGRAVHRRSPTGSGVSGAAAARRQLGRRPARHRQDRDPGRDPEQARRR